MDARWLKSVERVDNVGSGGAEAAAECDAIEMEEKKWILSRNVW